MKQLSGITVFRQVELTLSVRSTVLRQAALTLSVRSTVLRQDTVIPIFFRKHFNLRLLHSHHPPIVVDLVDSSI